MFAMIIFRNYNMGQILSFFAPGENQEDKKLKQIAQRRIKQDEIINEIKAIEQCIYCFIDHKIEKPKKNILGIWIVNCYLPLGKNHKIELRVVITVPKVLWFIITHLE